MNKDLYLDIETVPLLAALDAPYPEAERFPPSNYKNPEAIASWREKDEASWREARVKECSLTPRLGRLAALGIARGDDSPTVWTVRDESEERPVLETLWASFTPDTCVVTFNGSFDLNFLVVRSIVNGVVPVNYSHVPNLFRRYTYWPHFDCRAALTNWDQKATGKLAEWCAALGIVTTDETSAADVYEFAKAGAWDKITAHCKSDVSLTRELHKRIAPMFDRDAA